MGDAEITGCLNAVGQLVQVRYACAVELHAGQDRRGQFEGAQSNPVPAAARITDDVSHGGEGLEKAAGLALVKGGHGGNLGQREIAGFRRQGLEDQEAFLEGLVSHKTI